MEESRGLVLVSSRSNWSDHLAGSILLMMYFMPSILSISCLLWLMVYLIALWSGLCVIDGSTAQSLNVLSLLAASLANERSMTDGCSLLCQARWVISPLLLRRVKFDRDSQSAVLVASWSGLGALSSQDHVGWCRLKSPVNSVGCCGRRFSEVLRQLKMH